MVRVQDYPHDKIEWIIIDDGKTSNANIFPDVMDGIKIRYIYLKKKILLAKKRDYLNHLAKGVYLINMDDDDYYPPCRVSHAVETLQREKTDLVGSSKMYMYFVKNHTIYQLGPYKPNHGTAATLAYTKDYASKNLYYNPSAKSKGEGNFAEEGVFTERWSKQIAQLDPFKTVLALSHSDNTVDKNIFLEKEFGHIGTTIHKTDFGLDRFINKQKESKVYDFYNNLKYEFKDNLFTKKVVEQLKISTDKNVEEYREHMHKRMFEELQQANLLLYKQSTYDKYMRQKLNKRT